MLLPKLPSGVEWLDLTKVREESLELMAARSEEYWKELRQVMLVFRDEILPHLKDNDLENRRICERIDKERGRQPQDRITAHGVYMALFQKGRGVRVTIRTWNDTAIFTNGMHRAKAAMDLHLPAIPVEISYETYDPTDVPLQQRFDVYRAPGDVKIYSNQSAMSTYRYVCHNCRFRENLRPFGTSPISCFHRKNCKSTLKDTRKCVTRCRSWPAFC